MSIVRFCRSKTSARCLAKCHRGDSASERKHERDAFTLIELMVVISIIGILVSLTAPAVQSARESARRLECQNRIRQLALGVQMFHDTHRAIPNNGGPADDNLLSIVSGPAIQPWTFDRTTGSHYLWGVGDRTRSAKLQTGPWSFSILPYVELTNEYNSGAVSAPMPIFKCPSRSRGPETVPHADAYGRYESGGLVMTKADFCGNAFVMPNRPYATSFAEITDGLSSTIVLGEKSFDPAVHTASTWYWDEPIWIGGSKGSARSGLQVLPDRVGIPFKENWGSAHPGGALFAFVDGHVQLLSSSVDWQIMAATLSPNGRESKTLAK